MITNDEAAPLALRCLIEHVLNTEGSLNGVTYSELALRIGRLNKHGEGHGHGVGSILAIMGHMLERVELNEAWIGAIPHIQSLVIDKTGSLRGLPAEGISEFWPGYPELQKEEKLNKVHSEYLKIKSFGPRWNEVLRFLSLPEVNVTAVGGTKKNVVSRFGGGGESLQHKALKEFLSQNPTLVGASSQDQVCIEYALPSLDTLDVLFKGTDRWVAVEVKSKVSDNMPSDYERGLYQCVKYQSILEAMQKDLAYRVPDQIHVVLVLESNLPKQYVKLAEVLNANVKHNIRKI